MADFLSVCARGDVESVVALIEAGCDTAASTGGGQTGLMGAAGSGSAATAGRRCGPCWLQGARTWRRRTRVVHGVPVGLYEGRSGGCGGAGGSGVRHSGDEQRRRYGANYYSGLLTGTTAALRVGLRSRLIYQATSTRLAPSFTTSLPVVRTALGSTTCDSR